MRHSTPGTARGSAPARDSLLEEVLDGLTSPQPTLPCKLFYDELGSQLYERITALEEYYPYAAEVEILQRHGPAIAAAAGEGSLVVEYGSGSSAKTRLLLDALRACTGYVAIDISREHLQAAAETIARHYPALAVEAVCADFTGPVTLPARFAGHGQRLAFFPGSTIGNFDPPAAARLLASIRRVAGDGGRLLIGVDLPKDRATLERAYDDAEGVTAQFNLNILDHVNRLFDGNLDPGCFAHEAHWNESESRVEMHLRCVRDHEAAVAGTRIRFARGQSIWTESSYKHTPERFHAIGARAGFVPEAVWFDERRRYSLHLMRGGDTSA